MNIRHITVAATVLLGTSGSSWAQEAESDAWMHLESSRPRAEVRAELLAARASGELDRISAEAAIFEDPGLPAIRLARSTG